MSHQSTSKSARSDNTMNEESSPKNYSDGLQRPYQVYSQQELKTARKKIFEELTTPNKNADHANARKPTSNQNTDHAAQRTSASNQNADPKVCNRDDHRWMDVIMNHGHSILDYHNESIKNMDKIRTHMTSNIKDEFQFQNVSNATYRMNLDRKLFDSKNDVQKSLFELQNKCDKNFNKISSALGVVLKNQTVFQKRFAELQNNVKEISTALRNISNAIANKDGGGPSRKKTKLSDE